MNQRIGGRGVGRGVEEECISEFIRIPQQQSSYMNTYEYNMSTSNDFMNFVFYWFLLPVKIIFYWSARPSIFLFVGHVA